MMRIGFILTIHDARSIRSELYRHAHVCMALGNNSIMQSYFEKQRTMLRNMTHAESIPLSRLELRVSEYSEKSKVAIHADQQTGSIKFCFHDFVNFIESCELCTRGIYGFYWSLWSPSQEEMFFLPENRTSGCYLDTQVDFHSWDESGIRTSIVHSPPYTLINALSHERITPDEKHRALMVASIMEALHETSGSKDRHDSLLRKLDELVRQGEVIAEMVLSVIYGIQKRPFRLNECALRSYFDSREGANVLLYFKQSPQSFDQHVYRCICQALAKGPI